MSRSSTSGERAGSARGWTSHGHENLGLDNDQEDGPAAMEAEEFRDGRVVVNQGSNDPQLDVAEPEGCWYNFKKGLRSFWATRHTEDTKQDRELYIKTTLRELVVYIIFLIVLMILTFCMTSGTMYYYTKVMQELFLDGKFADGKGTLKTSTTLADFWRFAQGPLISGLFWETWYNNRNVSDNMKNFIYYENKLLGVPRIRQVKVRSDSCTIASNFQKDIKQCFASYSDAVEDKSAFGPMNSTAWNYSDAAITEGMSYKGQITTYEGGGYFIDITRDKESTLEIINELWRNLWLTRGTRAVFIDFTVYNANINLFCVIKLIMEFPATGGAIPSSTFRTVKLLRYVTPLDYFVLACEVIFLLFICYYIVEETIEIKKHKFSYFKSFWNWLDIIVIIISLVCAFFNIYRTITVGEKIQGLLGNENKYPDFDFLSYWQQKFNQAIAITVFLAWIKIFKYISFNKTMTQLSSTLGRCAKDLAGFAVMFSIIFFAFAQLGYLLFGTQVKDFREFHHSVFTLFRIILGDFDFHQLESAHSVLGPVFFILYVFFVFFVLINMFLAIINDTYSEVKSDLATQKNEFEMADYFKQRANKMFDKLNLKRDKIVDIQKAIQAADINKDNQLDFDEWRTELKNRGYADGEIEAVFAKYDLDGDRVLDEDEQRRMHNELEGQKMALSEQIADSERVNAAAAAAAAGADSDVDESDAGARMRIHGGVSIEEFSVLSRRVDRMEHSIGSIVSKIDAVLVKLEAMEKAKVKRREAMGRLLDSLTGNDEIPEEQRREQMERLVREELERWDGDGSGSPSPSDGRGATAGVRHRSRPGSSQPDSDMTSTA